MCCVVLQDEDTESDDASEVSDVTMDQPKKPVAPPVIVKSASQEIKKPQVRIEALCILHHTWKCD